jgi:hypothetical protein
MKYLLLFSICIICSCKDKTNPKSDISSSAVTAKDSRTTDSHYLDHLLEEYKDRTLVGLFFVDSVYAKKISPVLNLTTSSYCNIDAFFRKNIDSLTVLAEAYMETIEDNQRSEIVHQLKYWLKNDVLLSSVPHHLNEDLTFEEIISELPETRVFLKQYLKARGQYWGSLDGGQSCKLYYDVAGYLLTLNEEKRITFFKRYFDVVCRISLSSEKQ